MEAETLLGPFRALDLTDETAFLCGKVLGDLGADVIKIEGPGGDPARNMGPFYEDTPHPERSLYWWTFNTSKRGVTLDIGSAPGREIFRRLVKGAHFVIESFPPGYLDSLGLGYSALSELNPGIILTSITPFGQTGPYRHHKASDLTLMALGGLMYLCGDADRPPVRISFPQSYLHAGVEGAAATLVAHYHRERTGKGQHVDVSIQQCVVWTLMNARPFWDLNQVNLKRAGPFRAGLSLEGVQRLLWPCRDGHVAFAVLGGASGARTMWALMEWMEAEGQASDFLKAMDWDTFGIAQVTQEDLDLISEPLARFFIAHTKGELYRGALERRIMLYPVATARDVAEDPQLEARGFFQGVEHPELGKVIPYAGPFVRLSEAHMGVGRRPPLIGEHNREVYEGELGLSSEELASLKESKVI